MPFAAIPPSYLIPHKSAHGPPSPFTRKHSTTLRVPRLHVSRPRSRATVTRWEDQKRRVSPRCTRSHFAHPRVPWNGAA